MQPLGLTVKKSRKKYGQGGELMLIHRCVECGKLSINRIAADDIAELLFEVYEASLSLDTGMIETLEKDGIHLLLEDERMLVRRQLYGWKG
jgi:hypothetical protein